MKIRKSTVCVVPPLFLVQVHLTLRIKGVLFVFPKTSHIVALRSFIVASSCKGISYEYQDSGDVHWMADWSVIHVKSYGPQGFCPFTEDINVWFTKVRSLYHCVSVQDLIYFWKIWTYSYCYHCAFSFLTISKVLRDTGFTQLQLSYLYYTMWFSPE